MKPNDWPYPRLIAHRGAGFSAPENTLAAFKLGYESGFRMFECDVKLSADGVAYLLHDPTLERTTNGTGAAHQLTWAKLRSLDAGSWHSEAFRGEGLVSLDELGSFCIDKNCTLNIEIKPSPGFDRITGAKVAEQALQIWRDSLVQPLLTSFSPISLAAAKASAPSLPRGLLVHKFSRRWQRVAPELGCTAVIFEKSLCNKRALTLAKGLGLRCGAYTVNDKEHAQELIRTGVEMIITDQLDMPQHLETRNAPY
jgi:glycerophosphoryl diester phosphodiesterase